MEETTAKNQYNVFEPIPHHVLIGFDTLGKTYKSSVRLVNKGRKAHRLHIITPKCSNWKISYVKKGSIAVGMHEDVLIEFVPRKYQTYEQSFSVMCESESFQVLMTATPCANMQLQNSQIQQYSSNHYHNQTNIDHNVVSVFPSRIDFGRCKLGETLVKTVNFSTGLPVKYNFRIHIYECNSDFTISPTSGEIDPNSFIPIDIIFCPQGIRTSSLEFEFILEKEGALPTKCSVVGSVTPDLYSTTTKKNEERDHGAKAISNTQLSFYPPNSLKNALLVHDEVMGLKKNREISRHVEFENNSCPDSAITHKTKSKVVFAQNEGSESTFKTKLSNSILRSRAWGSTLNEEQQKKIVSRKMKEAQLNEKARKYAEAQKKKEIKWEKAIGEDLLSEQEIESLLKEKEIKKQSEEMAQRDLSRERKLTEANPHEKPIIDINFRNTTQSNCSQEEFCDNYPEATKRTTEEKSVRIDEVQQESKEQEPKSLAQLMQERIPQTLRVLEIPFMQRDAIETTCVDSYKEKPEFKDFDYLKLKVPLYYKTVGYQNVKPLPVNIYSKTYESIDFTERLLNTTTEKPVDITVTSPFVRQALQNRNSYYIPKSEYNNSIVAMPPKTE